MYGNDTVMLHNAGEVPFEIDSSTTNKQHTPNTDPVERSNQFFDVAHLDIAYGDTVAPGGIKYTLIIIDCKTHYTYIFHYKIVEVCPILMPWQGYEVCLTDSPLLYTLTLTPKRLVMLPCYGLQKDNVFYLQDQYINKTNGLVESTWQMISNMARTYTNDKQMPQ